MAFPLQAEERTGSPSPTAGSLPPEAATPPRRRRRRRRLPYVSGTILVVFVITGIFAPLLAPYDPETLDLAAEQCSRRGSPAAPRPHILGTDDLGRDVLSRLIYGARVSLLVAIAVVVVRRRRRCRRRRHRRLPAAGGSTPS